jgi:hypothetical protein
MSYSRLDILNYVLRTLEELAHDWDYSEPVTPVWGNRFRYRRDWVNTSK